MDASIRKLEIQLGQIADVFHKQGKGKFPNHIEHAKEIEEMYEE